MRVLMICPELPTENSPGSMAPGARQIQSIADAGIGVEIIDMRGIPKLKYLQVVPKVCRAIRDVDLIHAHFGYCGWLALLSRRLAFRRTPIIMSYMGDDLLGTPKDEHGGFERGSLAAARFNRRIAKHYDQVIVKSQEMAETLGQIPCHVIPNGVNLDIFQPAGRSEARRRLGWSTEGWKILFPGNPANPRKGFGLARKSIDLASECLGQPIDLVPLWGVKPDDVATYMNACNAMVMTSLIEGSPNVVKEALACNVNVVSVPVGDAHELLRDVRHCACVQRNAEEIGTALAQILQENTPSGGRDMIIRRRLSLSGVAEQVIDVYQQTQKHLTKAP